MNHLLEGVIAAGTSYIILRGIKSFAEMFANKNNNMVSEDANNTSVVFL